MSKKQTPDQERECRKLCSGFITCQMLIGVKNCDCFVPLKEQKDLKVRLRKERRKSLKKSGYLCGRY